jgi:hypothetical protein
VTEINRSDLFIIFKAAAQMCSVDSKVDEQEKQFLKKLAHTANLSSAEIREIRSSPKEDVDKLADKLSSQTAKKVFLLALATMAKADEELSWEEMEMLDAMTLKLNIGRVKTKKMSYKACENMVLKLLIQTNTDNSSAVESSSGEIFSDLDLL